MQLKISSLIVASVLLVAKANAYATPAGHEFIAPTSTDQRSPCPGLNTLANHGYLPRNGANFTVTQIMDAALGWSVLTNPYIQLIIYLEGFNVNWDGILVAAKFGLLSGSDATTFETMGLGPLALHNLIEHDASISRNDFGPDGLGDNVHFNETTFSTLANANPGKNYYDPVSAGLVQRDRLAHSVATNPNVTNTAKEFKLRSRESALYLSIFGDPLTGIASKEFVQIFFREERLPFAEGWTKPTTLITSDTLDPISKIVQSASNWTETESCEPLVLGSGIVL
ncbi:HEME-HALOPEROXIDASE domain-containing protein [Mycena sanguinolenta]|uniref:HEME-HALOPEROXIDASE domain-containing protein n=1 Tax=Mycena sanguinolenta TaxID=230812 RepID=A0A8H6YN17_9AGAR|nr:HEME-HALOPEROXIDASE domain-containing protein [Mycena sanguinolenta]